MMKTLTSIGPINSIARSEETHPLTWRLRDDAQPVWLEEYQSKDGYAAARKALDLIEGRTLDQPHEIFPVQLLVRDSTAAPRVRG